MRVKAIPPVADLETVAAARRAVPLVPDPSADCCARLRDRLDLSSREDARTWLTFLRGLGLVTEGSRGYVRTRREPTRGVLAEGLLAGVLGAREVLDRLESSDDDQPVTVEEAFAAIEGRVPRWERHRDPNWRATWLTRAGHLLDWLVVAGLAERATDGYRPVR